VQLNWLLLSDLMGLARQLRLQWVMGKVGEYCETSYRSGVLTRNEATL